MSDKIIVQSIIEIAGKPVENVEKALKFVKEKLEKEKKFKVVSIEIEEPELDEKTTLYGGFLDVEVKFETAHDVLNFIVDYTPTSIEVIEPENLKLDTSEFTGLLNDISVFMLKKNHEVRQLSAHIHMMQKNSKK